MGQQTLPPGFRFSPTDEELLSYYLRPKALGRHYHRATVADVDVYKFEPWDLPGAHAFCVFGQGSATALPSKDQEWYFFSAQDKKYSYNSRINRTTKKGYWKATGKDRKVFSGSCVIGLKKTLIYYEGKAPNGSRTNWIMHEYRLDEEFEKKENVVHVVVLCRIRKKGGPGPRNGEQYGASVLNERLEPEEKPNMWKVDDCVDTGRQDVVESKAGGNVFNLWDQVEVWKPPGQIESANVELHHRGTKQEKETPKIAPNCKDLKNVPNMKGIIEWDPELNVFFDSVCGDITPFLHDHGGDSFPCYLQNLDMQNPGTLFDSDTFPLLPTLLDGDGRLLQDCISPAFDESEILRQMSDLINDGKGVAGSTASKMPLASHNVPSDGDFIELDDIKAPLDNYVHRPPIHSSELESSEEQHLGFNADTKVGTSKESQDFLRCQGLATHRAWLQLPAAPTLLPQGILEGDVNIPISRESYRNAGKHHSGAFSGAGDLPHFVESSTQSYLSKHVTTYAVSKHEMLPARLCYASSFTDRQNCVLTVNDPANAALSSKAFAMQGKCDIDVDVARKLPATRIHLSSSTRNIDADAFERIPSTPASLSGLPVKSSKHSIVEVPSAPQDCDQKDEHANLSYTIRHTWKTPLRGLISKVKWSALRTRLIELENGMRAKFNDKRSVLGKPAAPIVSMEGYARPYDGLRRVLVAILCQVVAAVLISFCLFWGFGVLVSYAFSVSV